MSQTHIVIYKSVCVHILQTYYPPYHTHLAPSLGFLFEYYMVSASGYSEQRRWLSMIHNLQDGDALPHSDQALFYKRNKSTFTGWLFYHIGNIGTNGRYQLNFLTFVLHYFGLSRDGIDILSQYGYGVSLDMFDDFRKYHVNRADHMHRYIPYESTMYNCYHNTVVCTQFMSSTT